MDRFDPTQCACAHDMLNRLIGIAAHIVLGKERFQAVTSEVKRAQKRSRTVAQLNPKNLLTELSLWYWEMEHKLFENLPCSVHGQHAAPRLHKVVHHEEQTIPHCFSAATASDKGLRIYISL